MLEPITGFEKHLHAVRAKHYIFWFIAYPSTLKVLDRVPELSLSLTLGFVEPPLEPSVEGLCAPGSLSSPDTRVVEGHTQNQ
jgi:hypothetical protein